MGKFFRMNIRSKIIMGYVFIIICLGIAILIVSGRVSALQKEVDFVSTHDLEAHDLINAIQKNMVDMETGMRGFVITGDTQYLEPYDTANKTWLDNYNQLLQLVSYNAAQKESLEQIKPTIQSWIRTGGDKVIQLKKENNQAAVEEYFKQNSGKKLMDQLRTQFDTFLKAEKQLTTARAEQLAQSNNNLRIVLFTLLGIISIFAIVVALILSNSITNTIKQVTRMIRYITSSEGNLASRIELTSHDEIRELAEATNDMLEGLEKENWIQTNIAEVATLYQGISDIGSLSRTFISKLAPMLESVYGVVYLRENVGDEARYVKIAGYAASGQDPSAAAFRLGEGLVGQCALDQRIFLIDNLPENHVKLTSGLGASAPRSLLVAPILVDGQTEAVIELASLHPFQAQHLTLVDSLQEKFGSAITNVRGRMEVERLLSESQMLTEELQAQSEELQTQSEELQMQQEQLRMTNEFLEEQNHFSEQKALELKKAKDELEEYSQKLETSSQYKSDFLANMSHELRTPLNSIMILSQMLAENSGDLQMSEIVEYSRVVNAAGKDLLALIDDILDLSKVEAGKIEIMTDDFNVTEMPQLMKLMFAPVAEKKGLDFDVILEPNVPNVILTDGQRLQQILKNLLSNAFKFTEKGSVTMKIALADPVRVKELLHRDPEEKVLAISITDTGIGIPIDKQQVIFEAFRQVDGTTNRQYGGTGLGLSICREFTRLLGGSIVVKSELHKGSTFTLYVPNASEAEPETPGNGRHQGEIAATFEERPIVSTQPVAQTTAEAPPMELIVSEVQIIHSDAQLFHGKRVLLVDDDARNVFALVTALETKGVTVDVADHGKDALEMLGAHADYDLILMDIMMPVMDGYEAMQAIRGDLNLRDLPIIALTAKAMKSEKEKCLEAGASDYITKPLNMDQLFSLMRVWLTKQVKKH
ncbi:CHASE3 domain-containing protein [Paenibacillus aceris]|uniref:histidine kinase n=1 Tax=Paenibacillus aceris TaxID=869555 RepID=A0ABS4I1E6_9BACL|nr:CHASE3 domain-containing protein [Paenibacillus aceris]MBP1964738.1 two-component system chemotaxis sensor kinase CheA [Paenibacillus aceris]NHW33724.1 response regulator [Paenibacillus aceris]